MVQRLDHQVAIITGASRGIGRAIAQAYAAEGASLCLIATDPANLNEVRDSLGLPTERIMTIGLNVTDMVEELKAQVAHSSGTSGNDMVKAVLARVPLGRVLQPSEIATLAVYPGSAESKGMTGQSIHWDGGMILS